MSLKSRNITVKNESGDEVDVKGWFKVEKSTSLDEPASELETIQYIEIEGRIIQKDHQLDGTEFYDEKTDVTYRL